MQERSQDYISGEAELGVRSEFGRIFIHFQALITVMDLFIQAISIAPLQYTTTHERRSRHSTDTVLEFHAEAPQATASEGLAHGSYVAARAGFEAAILRTKDAESASMPPRPTIHLWGGEC